MKESSRVLQCCCLQSPLASERGSCALPSLSGACFAEIKKGKQLPRDPALQGPWLLCLCSTAKGLLPHLVQQRLGTSLVFSPLNPCLTPTRLVLLMLGKEKLGALATLAPPKDPGIFFTIFIYQMVS